jgi:hypothetical protein
MKARLQKLLTKEARTIGGHGAQPSELLDHLSVKLKSREAEIDRKQRQITDALAREADLKEKMGRLEFLYDLDPLKVAEANRPKAPGFDREADFMKRLGLDPKLFGAD